MFFKEIVKFPKKLSLYSHQCFMRGLSFFIFCKWGVWEVYHINVSLLHNSVIFMREKLPLNQTWQSIHAPRIHLVKFQYDSKYITFNDCHILKILQAPFFFHYSFNDIHTKVNKSYFQQKHLIPESFTKRWNFIPRVWETVWGKQFEKTENCLRKLIWESLRKQVEQAIWMNI